MTTFRAPTDTVTIPDDFYTPAPAYSPDASPGQDDRREQLDDPAEQLERVEPLPDDETDDLPADPRPLPYTPPPVTERPQAEPIRRATDAVTRTVTVGDDPVLLLSEDHRRRSWSVWLPSTSSAGVRLAAGRHARENVTATGTSVPLPAGAALDGKTGAPVALVSDTPGTAATVHLIAEIDAA